MHGLSLQDRIFLYCHGGARRIRRSLGLVCALIYEIQNVGKDGVMAGRSMKQNSGLIGQWLRREGGLPGRYKWVDLVGSRVAVPPPQRFPFNSVLCRQRHFRLSLYQYWCVQIKEKPRFHRKQWEFVYICQALHERNMLRPGNKGLGFGVGREPLVALFAKLGCRITATDMDRSLAEEKGWAESGQHAAALAELNGRSICSPEEFGRNVSYRTVDMNHIPGDLIGYDFCWSACALEHLGTLQRGIDFIKRSVDCLKPGGIAVHTTEYNLYSNKETLSEGDTVLYRRRDLKRLVKELRSAGHQVAPMNLRRGWGAIDRYIDVPPYKAEPHLKLQLDRYTATSVGLIVRKNPKAV